MTHGPDSPSTSIHAAVEEAVEEATGRLRRGDADGAAAGLLRALAAAPLHLRALVHLGIARARQERVEEALRAFRAALAVDPAAAPVWLNLALAERAALRQAEVAAAFRRAATADPGLERAAREAVLALNLVPAAPRDTLEAARRWAVRHVDRPAPAPPAGDPERRLRVGYLCEYILTHDHTCLPLVENHGPAVETVVYALRRPLLAGIEARYRAAAGVFRTVPDIDNAALAELVRADGIDILVEGAGLASPGQRLMALARRPAPLQVHFPVMTTTGMAAVDHLLVDPVLVPPGGEADFSEALYRLPVAYHFDPLMATPEPGPPPQLRRGFVTFGSFNTLSKVGDATLAAWARVLDRVPEARLLVKALDAGPLGERRLRGALTGVHGIAAERIEVRPPTPDFAGHYAAFDEVDVVLDSLPYGGVTTTMQALWMGVPVVVLAGARVLERYGATLLGAAGLGDAVAGSVADYVDTACRLAADPDRLARLRRTLRAHLRTTPLCDGRAFAGSVEAAYRALWRARCAVAGR